MNTMVEAEKEMEERRARRKSLMWAGFMLVVVIPAVMQLIYAFRPM